MENLNLYESEQVAPSQQPPAAVVSMDALGNTNQDIFSSNPFGDFNNQFISEVTMAKSTEITDMVMQQQPENEFCNLTDTLLTSNLNNINNNKINGSHDATMESLCATDNEHQQQLSPQPDPNVLILNDDNNNSNDNFNNPELPETDVDAIEDDDDDFQYHAGSEAIGGEKEKTQMEFKETDDVTDRVEMNFGSEIASVADVAIGSKTLENKIFEELSLHNPDMVMGGGINPFTGNEFIDNSAQIITDNKLMEEQIDEMQQEFKQEFDHGASDLMENLEREIDFEAHEQVAVTAAVAANENAFEREQELISANDDMNEEVAIQQHQDDEPQQCQQPIISDLGIIGAATNTVQGIEESEGSEDEWNYIKVEDKKESAVLEETSQNHPSVVESAPAVCEQEEPKEDIQVAPIEATAPEVTDIEDVSFNRAQFEENFTASDNKFVEELQQQEIIKEGEIDFETEQQSPVIEEETIKDLEQEKEPIIEESHAIDETEKNLQLHVETEEVNDMDSQLNPDAKEFVPLSPVRNEFQSPPPTSLDVENDRSPVLTNPILNNFTDTVVSQSPRKGDALIMEDVLIPEENDFDKEANERPHEVNLTTENFQRIESPSELNMKEAMQVDDKLEQEYKDDSQGFFEEEKQHGEEYQELEQSFSQYSNGFQNKIDDAMNRSFYEGRDSDILADPAKNVLNKTQPLPDDDEQSQQQRTVETSDIQKGELNLMGSGEPHVSQMESSDNFEVEKFVEEIKGVNENKYIDAGLSPTALSSTNQIETVEETIFATHSPMKQVQDDMLETFITQTSTASNIEAAPVEQEPMIEIPYTEIKENIPEEPIESLPEAQQAIVTSDMQEPITHATEPEKAVEDAKPEEPKTEILSAAVVGSAAAVAATVATTAAAKKKSPTGASSSKSDPKAKVASKTAEAKKTDVKPKTTTASKPASAPVSKTTVSKTSTTQVKSTVPSSATSRPKTTTASVPAAKKTPLASSAPKTTVSAPRPASASTTSVPKRPITSAPAKKTVAASKPATEVKSKVTAERKPLASSAPATRAPTKPTTLTSAKPKVNGTASTTTSSSVKSPSATRPASSRLNSSATDKSLSSPLKEKTLNKSAPSGTTTRSPRPASSTLSTAKTTTTTKTDLKSPSSTAAKSGLSAVGNKKPLTITRKPASADKTTTKTTTTITKKPATASGKSSTSSTVKKTTTTTTTVVKKKVVNGDIVMEETNTTTKTIGDDISTQNGHTAVNGNGIAENGNGLHDEAEHQLHQQAAIEPSLI